MPKLSKTQIAEIIKLYSEGKTHIELAKMFNVSQPTISYHTNPEVRQRTIKQASEDFKSLSIEERRVKYKKRQEYTKNWLKNKYKTDPEWREKMKSKSREYQKKKGLSFSRRTSDLQSGDTGAIPVKSIEDKQ